MSNKFTRNHKISKSKWFVPGVYVSAMAVVMIGAFAFQNLTKESDFEAIETLDVSGLSDQLTEEVTKSLTGLPGGSDGVEVTKAETFALPLEDSNTVTIMKYFYDGASSEEAQEAALVKYGDTYHPSTGIDYAMNDDSSFDVLATMSGDVTKVQSDGLLGNVIEIEHSDGIISSYSSVTDTVVSVGDKVEQGQILASASTSQINPDAGVHVHFELRKDGVAVNPTEYFDDNLDALENTIVTNGIETIKSEAVSTTSQDDMDEE